ncbi:hypothetical protein EJB05_16328, partial [Eragrostis curvula]
MFTQWSPISLPSLPGVVVYSIETVVDVEFSRRLFLPGRSWRSRAAEEGSISEAAHGIKRREAWLASAEFPTSTVVHYKINGDARYRIPELQEKVSKTHGYYRVLNPN